MGCLMHFETPFDFNVPQVLFFIRKVTRMGCGISASTNDKGLSRSMSATDDQLTECPEFTDIPRQIDGACDEDTHENSRRAHREHPPAHYAASVRRLTCTLSSVQPTQIPSFDPQLPTGRPAVPPAPSSSSSATRRLLLVENAMLTPQHDSTTQPLILHTTNATVMWRENLTILSAFESSEDNRRDDDACLPHSALPTPRASSNSLRGDCSASQGHIDFNSSTRPQPFGFNQSCDTRVSEGAFADSCRSVSLSSGRLGATPADEATCCSCLSPSTNEGVRSEGQSFQCPCRFRQVLTLTLPKFEERTSQ